MSVEPARQSMSDQEQPVFLADKIDTFILNTGQWIAWCYGILVAVIILQVVLRYGFANGLVVLEELEWHLYAVGVMFGVSYAQATNSHIRVDLFHNRLRKRTQRIFEIAGILLLLMPFILVIFIHSLDFVADSYRIGERSDAPTGLPLRWLIKGVIPASFLLLFAAAMSRLIREATLLRRGV